MENGVHISMRCPIYAGLREQTFGAVDGVNGGFGSLILANCMCVCGGGGAHVRR